eukprot:618893-Pyramimonas_sp.AAC.1
MATLDLEVPTVEVCIRLRRSHRAVRVRPRREQTASNRSPSKGIYRIHRPISAPRKEYTASTDQSQSFDRNRPHPALVPDVVVAEVQPLTRQLTKEVLLSDPQRPATARTRHRLFPELKVEIPVEIMMSRPYTAPELERKASRKSLRGKLFKCVE